MQLFAVWEYFEQHSCCSVQSTAPDLCGSQIQFDLRNPESEIRNRPVRIDRSRVKKKPPSNDLAYPHIFLSFAVREHSHEHRSSAVFRTCSDLKRLDIQLDMYFASSGRNSGYIELHWGRVGSMISGQFHSQFQTI